MAKLSKEERQNIARESNVKRWSTAIKNYTGGTEVFVALNIAEEDWKALDAETKLKAIGDYREQHEDLKLPPNKKSIPTIDYRSLCLQLSETESDEVKKKLLERIKQLSNYDKAKEEVEISKDAYEKAKKRYEDAKEKLKQLENQLTE